MKAFADYCGCGRCRRVALPSGWLRVALRFNPRFIFAAAGVIASLSFSDAAPLSARPAAVQFPVPVLAYQSAPIQPMADSVAIAQSSNKTTARRQNSRDDCGGKTISDADAIAIIIGESGGEPYSGQVAVAAVLRRRNSTKGFYGLKNPVVAKASEKTAAKAAKAWAESATNDPSNGATHFENIKAFGVPKWAAGKKPCATIGNHTFYKL